MMVHKYINSKYKKFILKTKPCPRCWGMGYIWAVHSTDARLSGQVLCPTCLGRGEVDESEE